MACPEADGATSGARSESRQGRTSILSTAFVRDSSQDSAGSAGSPKHKMSSPRIASATKEEPRSKKPSSARPSPRVSPRGVRPPALGAEVESEVCTGPESRAAAPRKKSAQDDGKEDAKETVTYSIGTPPASSSLPGRRIGAEVPPPNVALRTYSSPSQSTGAVAWPISPRDSLRPRGAASPGPPGGPGFFGGSGRGSGASRSPGRRGPGVSGAAAVAAVTVGTPGGQNMAGCSASLRWASPPPVRSSSPGSDCSPEQPADFRACGSRGNGRDNSRGSRDARTPLTAPPRVGATSPSRCAGGGSARRLFGTPGPKCSATSSLPLNASGRNTPTAGRDSISGRRSPKPGQVSSSAARGFSPPPVTGGAGVTGGRKSPGRTSPGNARAHSPVGQMIAVWEQAASAASSPRERAPRASKLVPRPPGSPGPPSSRACMTRRLGGS